MQVVYGVGEGVEAVGVSVEAGGVDVEGRSRGRLGRRELFLQEVDPGFEGGRVRGEFGRDGFDAIYVHGSDSVKVLACGTGPSRPRAIAT